MMLFWEPEGLNCTEMTFGIVVDSIHAARLRSIPISVRTLAAPGLFLSSSVSR